MFLTTSKTYGSICSELKKKRFGYNVITTMLKAHQVWHGEMNIVFQSVTSSFDNFLVVHFIERYKPYWTLSIVLLKCGTEMTAWSFEMNPEIRWLTHCFSAVIFFH